jgi:hypothetical protein
MSKKDKIIKGIKQRAASSSSLDVSKPSSPATSKPRPRSEIVSQKVGHVGTIQRPGLKEVPTLSIADRATNLQNAKD